jgi:hypothetical protein
LPCPRMWLVAFRYKDSFSQLGLKITQLLGGGDRITSMKAWVELTALSFGVFAISAMVIRGVSSIELPSKDSKSIPISRISFPSGNRNIEFNSVKSITYIRFPDCSSCGGTTDSVLGRLKTMGPVIIGMDKQPNKVRSRVLKTTNVLVIEWNALPKAWKRLLPGIYQCNVEEAWCKQVEG